MIDSFFRIAIVFAAISVILTITSEILSSILTGQTLDARHEIVTLCMGFGIFLFLIWVLYFWNASRGVFEQIIIYLVNKEKLREPNRHLEFLGFLFYKNRKNVRLFVWMILTVLFPVLIMRAIISIFDLDGYWSAIGMLPAMGVSISGLFFWESAVKDHLFEKPEGA